MYSTLHDMLADKKGGAVFTCFGVWHLCYIAIAIAALTLILLCLRGKGGTTKSKLADTLVNVAFGLYVADFFLMPFAYGEIDVEKLPFHICTAMCVMLFISRHNRFLGRYSLQFALFGFISNLIYLVYPAGVMWHQVHPLSYRVVQTLLFHAVMAIACLLVVIYGEEKPNWKRCYRDLAVIASMTLWAMLGNALYNGTAGDYSHFFNWFFVVRDPFYALPESIAPYVMPILNVAAFFAVDMLVYSVYFLIKKVRKTDP